VTDNSSHEAKALPRLRCAGRLNLHWAERGSRLPSWLGRRGARVHVPVLRLGKRERVLARGELVQGHTREGVAPSGAARGRAREELREGETRAIHLLLRASGGRTGSVAECGHRCIIESCPTRAVPRLVVRRCRGHEREERDRAERCGRTPLSPSSDEMAAYDAAAYILVISIAEGRCGPSGAGMARTPGGRE
jgi:hypothetical protein